MSRPLSPLSSFVVDEKSVEGKDLMGGDGEDWITEFLGLDTE